MSSPIFFHFSYGELRQSAKSHLRVASWETDGAANAGTRIEDPP